MFHSLKLSLLGAVAAATVSAGQIQLSGTTTNVAGYGLTGNTATFGANQYIEPAGQNNCAGKAGGNSCANAAMTGVVKGNYVVSLFSNATGITPPDGAQQTSAQGQINSGFTSGGSPIKFDLINTPNGAAGYCGTPVAACANVADVSFLRSNTAANNSLILPVGLNEISSVYTMLNDFWGLAGANNITVSFCFSVTSNGSCLDSQLVKVQLTSGVEVRAAVVCDSNAGATGCATGYGQTLAPSTVVNGVTVNTSNVYSQTYTSIPTMTPNGYANATPWAGSTNGRVVLDAQQFVFTPTTQFLSYIQINDANPGNWSAGSTGVSQFALSAVTVEQAPEPASLALLFAGLGGLGLVRLRRRA